MLGLIRWMVIPFIKGCCATTVDVAQPLITAMPEEAPVTNKEEVEVTVEDMVLHDMMNDNDTYDIGVIDFGD